MGIREEDCQKVSPRLWKFIEEMFNFALASTCLMAIGAYALRHVKRKVVDLQMNFGYTGPVQLEVLRQVWQERTTLVEAQAECSICLDGDDDVEAGQAPVVWRALRCGHAFHEQCLLEWLGRNRRCPLCRLDVQQAHVQESQPENGQTSEIPALRQGT